MTSPAWQLQKPVTAIIFDCDGTLSKLEGVNELAKLKGVEKEVSLLTNQAMSQSGLNPNLYHERLSLISPHYDQVQALGQQYYEHRATDVLALIHIFQRLDKQIYLVSAGVNPAVTIFGTLMNILKEHIFAVDLRFNEQGNYVDFDRQSLLIFNEGKGEIVSRIKKSHAEIMYVGDGMNDLVAKAIVRRFIGYGGVFYRESIAQASDFYIHSSSMTPLLPLTLTAAEVERLLPDEKEYYALGLKNMEKL